MISKEDREKIENVSIPYSTIKIFLSPFVIVSMIVSIPYSTIKIPRWRQSPRAVRVSIPYSTIKIDHGGNQRGGLTVSIPYSTIKISYSQVISALTPWFQFLIVRLKFREISLPRTWPSFQFLIVRLKFPCFWNLPRCIGVSIPYSTIKIFK